MLKMVLKIALPLAALVATATMAAATCTNADVAAVIDQTGETLRRVGTDAKQRIDHKIRELAGKRGWADSEIETRAAPFLAGASDQAQDEKAATLLMRLDQLGDEDTAKAPACERLAEAKTAAAELVAATERRTARVLARMDAAMNDVPNNKPQVRRSDANKPVGDPPVARKRQTAPSQPKMPWSTQTVEAARPAPERPTPPTTPPLDPTFSAEEIADAGRGLFGTISSNLAAVIQYAISEYGRPTGYILGTEGSGAFIAGLRYGSGRLALKDGRHLDVHWQGPSLGYDFGATGSRVMFLVYGIERPEDVFRRFAGIDGSAYVVGGAGITFLKRGNIIMAPIRTGLGLRIGANVGYLKFTPERSLNPF
ncbi:MAG: hypothetical protein RLZ98_2407 [Pseudomonadota bacterium]|jgi:hypothetical protein